LQHGAAQIPRVAFEALIEAGEAEKGFVDRIDLEIGREAGDHPHHPCAHIP
jgi:hypothetical protein